MQKDLPTEIITQYLQSNKQNISQIDFNICTQRSKLLYSPGGGSINNDMCNGALNLDNVLGTLKIDTSTSFTKPGVQIANQEDAYWSYTNGWCIKYWNLSYTTLSFTASISNRD